MGVFRPIPSVYIFEAICCHTGCRGVQIMSRSEPSLVEVAESTIQISRNGGYEGVDFSAQLQQAIQGTRTVTPAQSQDWLHHPTKREQAPSETLFETSSSKAQTVVLDKCDGDSNWLVLNFASARNRGGGFLRGAQAQEEDLCRCSSLFTCLTQPSCDEYYTVNGLFARQKPPNHLMYTDYMIYSPSVPFFRDEFYALVPVPQFCAVITCPAPNRAQCKDARSAREQAALEQEYDQALDQRIGRVLACAEAMGHRKLILGGWGTGVFGNPPALVASSFKRWLTSDRFKQSFTHVVFAVWQRKGSQLLDAFSAEFSN